MAASRRRFLAVAGAALCAGCNESSQPESDGTVTPVDVPMSGEEAFAAADAIETPRIPPSLIVSDDHRRAIIGAAEALVDSAESELDAADGVELSEFDGRLRNAQEPLEAARSRIEALRDAETPQGFTRFGGRFLDAGRILGYVRAETGRLDVEGVRGAVEAERQAHRELVDDFEYRIASPAERFLPTAAEAEDALGRFDNGLEIAERRTDDLDPETAGDLASDIGLAWGRTELARFAKRTSVEFQRTATDTRAPRRRGAIDAAIQEQVDAVSELEPNAPVRENGGNVPPSIESILASFSSRRASLLEDARSDSVGDANRIEFLVRVARMRLQLEGFIEGASLTLELLDGTEFPAKRVPAEKRLAVERMEALADGSPLERELGRFSADAVRYGDRLAVDRGNAPVATAHFAYVSARSFVEGATARARDIVAALEPSG